MCMQEHICVEATGQPWIPYFGSCLPSVFWAKVSQWDLGLTNCTSWLTRKPQWSTCLCLSRTRITVPAIMLVLMWGLGTKWVHILVQHIIYWLGYLLSPWLYLHHHPMREGLTLQSRQVRSLQSSCLRLSRDEITGMGHHSWTLSSVLHIKKQSSKY